MEYASDIIGVQSVKEGVVVSLMVRYDADEKAKEYNFHITRIHPGACTLNQIIDSQEVDEKKTQDTA